MWIYICVCLCLPLDLSAPLLCVCRCVWLTRLCLSVSAGLSVCLPASVCMSVSVCLCVSLSRLYLSVCLRRSLSLSKPPVSCFQSGSDLQVVVLCHIWNVVCLCLPLYLSARLFLSLPVSVCMTPSVCLPL